MGGQAVAVSAKRSTFAWQHIIYHSTVRRTTHHYACAVGFAELRLWCGVEKHRLLSLSLCFDRDDDREHTPALSSLALDSVVSVGIEAHSTGHSTLRRAAQQRSVRRTARGRRLCRPADVGRPATMGVKAVRTPVTPRCAAPEAAWGCLRSDSDSWHTRYLTPGNR